jgi:hypothetical protein
MRIGERTRSVLDLPVLFPLAGKKPLLAFVQRDTVKFLVVITFKMKIERRMDALVGRPATEATEVFVVPKGKGEKGRRHGNFNSFEALSAPTSSSGRHDLNKWPTVREALLASEIGDRAVNYR